VTGELAPAAGTSGCRASFATVPDGATVTLDGRALGETPLADVEVPCGQPLSVTMAHPRYRKVDRRLTVNAGEPATVEARLVRPAASVKLVTTPPGAIITVDGKVVGKSPAVTESTAFGSVYVTATLSGYKVWAGRVRVPSTNVTVRARLEPVPSTR
jgi:hypothetical protein